MMSQTREMAKIFLKRLRAWPLLNVPATYFVRWFVRFLHLDDDFAVRHLPRVGMVSVSLPNGRLLRLWSRGDDGIASRVFWRGFSGHEPETMDVFFPLATDAELTLDIGAHVGFFALVASLANRRGRVYAFEPFDRVRERLEKNVASNPESLVTVVPAAVGARSGRANFYHSRVGIPSSSSLSKSFMQSVVSPLDLEESPVSMLTVDEFLESEGLEAVDLVKIDAEGTSADVLRGMTKTMQRCKPTIICEVLAQDPVSDLQSQLEQHGYRAFLLTNEGPVEKQPVEAHPQWRNYLFSPR